METEGHDVPPPEGWEEGGMMPGPDPTKPDWYVLTQGPCPDDRKPFFNIIEA